jgi:hypothetical protein
MKLYELSFCIRRACLIIGLLFLTAKLEANPVDSITAKSVAANFYTRNYNVKIQSLSLVYTEKSSQGNAEYYIYNVLPDSGFVIVSADDAAHPILGYSSEGYFPSSQLTTLNSQLVSPCFSFWMQKYKKQIDYIRTNNLNASDAIQNEWTAYKYNLPLKTGKVASSAVTPLVKTIWAQAPYFNSTCPDNCVAGCVATAMAQIMKYWSFPPHGIGSNIYDDFPYGTLYAVFDTTQYDWAAMPDKVTGNNPAVATLSYQCGVSVDMTYTPNSSGSYMIVGDDSICAQSAFTAYFDYYQPTIQGLYEYNFNSGSWSEILENELNNNRPFMYAGSGDSGSHAWVCDGYDASGNFHMNWGWTGYEDGYYNLNALDPDKLPLSSNEEALIGIEPNLQPVNLSNTVNVYPTLGNGTFTVQLQDASLAGTNLQFSIYDMLGQKIYSTTLTHYLTLITITVPPGMYIFRAYDSSGKPVSTGKMVM